MYRKPAIQNHPAKVLVAWLAGFSKSILRKEEENKAKDKATKAQHWTKHYTQLWTTRGEEIKSVKQRLQRESVKEANLIPLPMLLKSILALTF